MNRWNVLAAVSLGTNTDGQARRAMETAAAFSADLTLLYVGPDRVFARRIGARNGETCQALLESTPAQTITRYTHACDADLLLLMDENFGARRRFWQSSTAEEVARLTPKPILSASHCTFTHVSDEMGRRERPYGSILCLLALDGSDDAVLDHARQIAGSWGVQVVLLTVVPEMDEGILQEMIPRSSRPLCPNAALEQLHLQASRLSSASKLLVRSGSPRKAIQNAVKDHSIDLVITTRPFLHGGSYYRFDANSIRHKLHCPVLSVVEGASLRPARQSATAAAVSFEETYVLKR